MRKPILAEAGKHPPPSRLMRPPDPIEAARLAAARRGDQQEFSGLTEPYRHELQVHCYRILGSFHDAEDLVQETLLRAWRRLDTYQGRASFRAWLYKIATNACLDKLDRRRTQRSLPPGVRQASDPHAPIEPPILEPIWLEPFPDEWLSEAMVDPEGRYTLVESVSFAFLAALQILPPRQRAALILSDVLDWSAREIAELLGLTISATNSALHRARATLNKQYHGREPEKLSPARVDRQTRLLLDRFMRAWERADVDGLVALLKEGATFAMPPSPAWYRGPASIGAFTRATVFADDGMFSGQASGRWRLLPTRANGRPAFAVYQRGAGTDYQAFGLHVLTLEAGQIVEIISFIDPSLPTRFGLPPTLTS